MPLVLSVEKKYLNKLHASKDLAGKHWSEIDEPPKPNDEGVLDVISTPLGDIQRYGNTVAWLLDLAKSIFGKQLSYIPSYGDLWIKTGNGQNFERADTSKELTATTYWYRPPPPQGPFKILGGRCFSLSRYWSGPLPALAEAGIRDQKYFADSVKARDHSRCVISNVDAGLIASHLIPNRVPHEAILMILKRHSPEEANLQPTGWGNQGWGKENANNDPRIGILAFGLLDAMINNFTLGFYCQDPVHHSDTYTLHSFGDANANYNVLGIKKNIFGDIPGAGDHSLENLHGFQVTFDAMERPLHAALNWHYMQCVLRKLATSDYKNLPVW